MNRSAALSVAVVVLGLLTASCAQGESHEKAAEQGPAAQEAADVSGGPDDLSHHTVEIDGITHHMNKPPEPSAVEDYSRHRPDAPKGVSYRGEVSTVSVAAVPPEEADVPTTDELQIGWLARDDHGCAWYADMKGRKHPLFGLEGSRTHEGGITFAGNFGEVHVDVGDTIAGEGRFVDAPAGSAPC